MWNRSNEAVQSLNRARTGVSVVAIAQAFGQLSCAAWDLADAVERRVAARSAWLAARNERRTRVARAEPGASRSRNLEAQGLAIHEIWQLLSPR
jgi:uncharacterized protein with PhoU and TrkA domain